jgi:uncharacterized protein (TIGR00730 family)
MALPKSVCVFCGAQNSVPDKHLKMGEEFGRMLAEKGIAMVYGGGDCGIMGRVANASMKHKGKVLGVFPMALKSIENEHPGLTETIIVEGMHERKKIMFDRSEALVVLPGGFGTMDEMFEVITWKQIGLHSKPIVIFNHDGYWDPLAGLMDNIINTGFALKETRHYFKIVTSLEDLFRAIEV